MKKISNIESIGGNGSFKGSVLIDSKKYDALPEETQSNISWKASGSLQAIQELIDMEWAKENEHADRVNHSDMLAGLFTKAGFEAIYVKVIDNEYCKKACCYKYPWVIVTTSKGRIKFGWRKSVMNLDWSDSDLGIDGEKLFKDEDVTKGYSYIHCWGEDKAVEYLKKLNSEG